VGAICLSTYVRKDDGTLYEHEIARISGIDLQLRQHMTELVDGQVTLNPDYYGRVVEFDGQGISAREKRVRHATFLTFRNDKDKDGCEISESFLEKQII
jgi:hypothetical protein